jgi:hypothetical protein
VWPRARPRQGPRHDVLLWRVCQSSARDATSGGARRAQGGARDRPRATPRADRGFPPVGLAPAADLRGRPARVSDVPGRDAGRRLQHADGGDRTDPHPPSHPRGARRRAKPHFDASPRDPRGGMRVTSGSRHPNQHRPPGRTASGAHRSGGGRGIARHTALAKSTSARYASRVVDQPRLNFRARIYGCVPSPQLNSSVSPSRITVSDETTRFTVGRQAVVPRKRMTSDAGGELGWDGAG